MGDVMGEFMGTPFDLLLGRRTYEIFAALLAERRRRPRRQAAERRHQVRRLAPATRTSRGAPLGLIEGDVPARIAGAQARTGRSSRCTAAGT